jgi:hypothetical protein
MNSSTYTASTSQGNTSIGVGSEPLSDTRTDVRGMSKYRSCTSVVLDFFSFLCLPVQGVKSSSIIQVVTMPSVNRQPKRGLPMVMPHLHSPYSIRSGIQREDKLNHYPDAVAVDCYLSDCQQLRPEKHPAQQFVRPSHTIPGDISDNERDAYDT